MSPALRGELDHLTRHDGTVPATTSELRIEYASLVGWTGGLVIVIAMLDQLQQGSADIISQKGTASQDTMPILVKLSGADPLEHSYWEQVDGNAVKAPAVSGLAARVAGQPPPPRWRRTSMVRAAAAST